jgi:IclR family transcriptional regulator, acetate operon repressor
MLAMQVGNDGVPFNGTGTMAGGHTPASGTESASRVADVLLVLADGPHYVGVSEGARRLGLSKTVVHRILRSLASRRLVSADDARGRYCLGPAAAALGARAMRDLDLRAAAMPVLRRLHAATDETTTVSALVGTARIYLDQVVSLNEIKMTVEVGRPFPLHAGASSKALLAAAGPELQAQVLDGELAVLTPLTIVSRDRLRRELDAISETGVAVSHGERQDGAGSVAAAVIGVDDHVIGAISLCGPVARFGGDEVKRYRPLVRDAAAEISAGLRAFRTADGEAAA